MSWCILVAVWPFGLWVFVQHDEAIEVGWSEFGRGADTLDSHGDDVKERLEVKAVVEEGLVGGEWLHVWLVQLLVLGCEQQHGLAGHDYTSRFVGFYSC